MPFPMGEIVFEKYVRNDQGEIDDHLEKINTIPEYIQFVNEVQEAVFNGTREEDGPERIYTRTYEVKDASGDIVRRYRFHGQSLHPENIKWDGTTGGATDVLE